MVTNPKIIASQNSRFDDDEVDAEGRARKGDSTRQAILEESADCGTQVGALAMVDRLLHEPERPRCSPADLHDHELHRWTRVDGDDVELAPSDADVPSEDGPAKVDEPGDDRRLGIIAARLGVGPHVPTLASGPHLLAARTSPAAHRPLTGDRPPPTDRWTVTARWVA